MKPRIIDFTIRLLAIPVGLFGLYFIAISLQAFYQELTTSSMSFGWKYILALLFIGLFIGSIILGLCGVAIYTAVLIWKQITASRIRWLMAFYAVALWGLIMNLFWFMDIELEDMTRIVNEHSISSVTLIVCALVYVFTSRWLIAHSSLGLQPPQPAARSWIVVFCFLIWIGLSGMTDAWSQTQPRASGVPDFWFEALIFLGPILFAWLLFKSIVYYQDLRFKRHEQSRQQEPVTV